ncbi:MAG: fumarylacetoacetate hydrolase family protein, partial [Propionibacteriaceae bacterium]|nr:fumarylacetoacetate hydrolase family protein [Propionibacteriaceae bacterium]
MRIARYSVDGTIRYGVVELETDGTGNPDTVSDLTGDPLSGSVKLAGVRRELADVRLLSPLLPRSKVIGVEPECTAVHPSSSGAGSKLALFLKPNTSVIGPGEAIQIPAISTDTVVEGRLAIIIGRICRSVPPERVPEVVFGYTVSADVTARDLTRPGLPWGLAKSWDTFTPLGPWIVTHLSLEEISAVKIVTMVDETGVTMSTKDLVADLQDVVSFVSSVMTLLPSDVILVGAAAQPTIVRAGQSVSVE